MLPIKIPLDILDEMTINDVKTLCDGGHISQLSLDWLRSTEKGGK